MSRCNQLESLPPAASNLSFARGGGGGSTTDRRLTGSLRFNITQLRLQCDLSFYPPNFISISFHNLTNKTDRIPSFLTRTQNKIPYCNEHR